MQGANSAKVFFSRTCCFPVHHFYPRKTDCSCCLRGFGRIGCMLLCRTVFFSMCAVALAVEQYVQSDMEEVE